jgi:hypothetical protein
MIGSIKISRITNSTAELDGFKRVGIVEGDEFGDKVGAL